MRVALQSDYDGGTLFQSHQRLRTWSESNSFSERAEKALKALREQRVVSEHICCNAAGSPLNGNKFNKHLKKGNGSSGYSLSFKSQDRVLERYGPCKDNW